MKEGLPPDEIEPIAHVNGNSTEAAPHRMGSSKELTPEAEAAMNEEKERAKSRGDAPNIGKYAVPSKTFLEVQGVRPVIPEVVRKQNEEALRPIYERMEREATQRKEEDRLRREQQSAAARLQPEENTTIASTGKAATLSEEIELRGEAAQLHEGESPTSGVQAEEPHWTTEEELEARRPKKKESVIKRNIKSAANVSAAAVVAGGRIAGKSVKKAATAGARALADTTDFYADSAKRLGKEIAAQARKDGEKTEAFIRAKYTESDPEASTPLFPERPDATDFIVGDGLDALKQNETTDIPLETLEHELAEGVSALQESKILEKILNSPEGQDFGVYADTHHISPEDPRIERIFEAYKSREAISAKLHSLFDEILSSAGVPRGEKQSELLRQHVESLVSERPEELLQLGEVFRDLDVHRTKIDAYQSQLRELETALLSQMSIYLSPETPLPANPHDAFEDGYWKQAASITYEELADRERTFQLALSGSQGHKGWKEPVLSWIASAVTRDWQTPEEKKAIERLAYEFKSDREYATISERCAAELKKIQTLRAVKEQNDVRVAEKNAAAELIKEQMVNTLKGTKVWDIALGEAAKATAKSVQELLDREPLIPEAANLQAHKLNAVDEASERFGFEFGKEIDMEKLRETVISRLKRTREVVLRKVLAETPVGAGGLDAMFSSVDALVASPEIGKHDTAQAVAHIYHSVEKIIPELPDGRAFYARTVLLKLRAKYGEMVDAKLEPSAPPSSPQSETTESAPPSEQTQEAQSSDEVMPGYMPSGMMDEEEVTPARVEEVVEAPPVREPDEIMAPEASQSGRSVHLPATIDTAAIPADEHEEGGQPELSIPEQNVTTQAEVDVAIPTENISQISAETAVPRPEVEITLGERMKVLGPTGSIESGWVVEKVDGDAKIVTLAKEGAKRRNKLSVKEIPVDTLKSWQEFADRETLERAFAEVKDTAELFDTFAKLKGIWEGGVFYSSDELVNRVEQARIDPSKINQVPNIGKLRAIVRALPTEPVNEQLQEGNTRKPYSDPLAEAVARTGEEQPFGSKKVSWKKREQQAAKNAVLPIESTRHKDVYTAEAFEQYLVDIESFEKLRELLEKTDHVIAGKNEFSGKYLLEQLARAERSGAADWMPGSIPGLQELVAKLLHKRVAEKQ